MNLTQFSPELAKSLIDSSNQFPVDFNHAWRWLGFSTKRNAKVSFLQCDFIDSEDYKIDLLINHEQVPSTFQTTEECITLTIEAFKSWGMMARTEQGKLVRKYFLECEKALKSKKSNQPNIERAKERGAGMIARREFTDTVQTFNPTSMDYAIATNHAYRGAFGMSAVEIKVNRGLKTRQSARDELSTVELAVIRLTELAVARKTVDSLNQLNQATFLQAQAISQALKII